MTSEPPAGRLTYEPSEANAAFCAKRETSVKRFARKAPVVQAKLIQKIITKEGNTRSSQKTRKTLSWNILSHNAILHS